MKKENDFRDRLQPFDDLYREMYSAIRKRLEAMTEAELKQTMLDTLAVSDRNCGWTMYDVAPIVRDIGRYVSPQATESNEPAQAEGKIITEDMVNGNDCKNGQCS